MQNIPNGVAEFVLVVQLGSFSKAALTLNLSRSRMSQIVSALEKEVGVQLLHRSTRALSLTAAGQLFFARSLQGIEQISYAVESAKDSHSAISGEIRINSVGGYFGEQILAPLLTKFMQLHPQISINLSFSSVRVAIIEEQFDLVLRMGELPDSSLIGRHLHTYQNYLVASPEYLRSCAKLETPDDLAAHRLINGSVSVWQFIKPAMAEGQKTAKKNVTVRSSLQCANGNVAMRAALDGIGITRQPSYYLAEALERGSLIAILPNWQLESTALSLIYPKVRYAQPRIQVLVEYLVNANYSA